MTKDWREELCDFIEKINEEHRVSPAWISGVMEGKLQFFIEKIIEGKHHEIMLILEEAWHEDPDHFTMPNLRKNLAQTNSLQDTSIEGK